MTQVAGDALVFDTGPLRHFAQQGWLNILRLISGDRLVVIPASVEQELRHQARELPNLEQIREASWITVDRGDDLDFVVAFAEFERNLVVGTRNRGECGVLALGVTRGWELVLDDSVARTLASERGLRVTSTLSLMCLAIREGLLTVPLVEMLADDLLMNHYYLPFEVGGFRQWALREGLLPYE